MTKDNLNTYAKNTWCPGCGNFSIVNAAKAVLKEMSGEGVPLENFVILSGIGCHAKIVDYIDVNSFYTIHGRSVPVAEGIKLAKPGMKVICFVGDGDSYGEGLAHLIFAAKRNIDITVIVHNNRTYALTTGQFSPTSPLGFVGRSTPHGTVELPFNPLELLLAAGATFIGRAYTHGIDRLKDMMKQAILHKGFSLVDVLQVSVIWYNEYAYYDKHVYDLKDHNPEDYRQALDKIREWNYNEDAPIALGTFYKTDRPTFEEGFKNTGAGVVDRREAIKGILKAYI